MKKKRPIGWMVIGPMLFLILAAMRIWYAGSLEDLDFVSIIGLVTVMVLYVAGVLLNKYQLVRKLLTHVKELIDMHAAVVKRDRPLLKAAKFKLSKVPDVFKHNAKTAVENDRRAMAQQVKDLMEHRVSLEQQVKSDEALFDELKKDTISQIQDAYERGLADRINNDEDEDSDTKEAA